MSRAPQVAVVGAGAPDERLGELAGEVGGLLAESGAVVICGGLRGVMDEVARGAAEAGGTVIGIVPGPDPADANPHCTHVIAAGTGIARNLAVVASADAVIAIGGAWGTLSEIAHARQLGLPVIALETWAVEPPTPFDDGLGIELAADPAEAVGLALGR